MLVYKVYYIENQLKLVILITSLTDARLLSVLYWVSIRARYTDDCGILPLTQARIWSAVHWVSVRDRYTDNVGILSLTDARL